MNQKKEREIFNYTYSAKQQEEVNQIRQKYLPKEESKMEQLRKLDESATKPGTIASIVAGVIGILLLGIGMCCTLVWQESLFLLGIIIGLLGIVCVILAYPLYMHITKREREKIAPQILKLTEEIIQQK